ncbi:MAG: NUDIX domain-containing protein [Beijerinckiaceae bacterium]|jgi:8-oxo-dGTP pyrophosphatase MutT (NUDIX family)|nr:NUDIX domain-containing protein [Beijerinckiaceae bacterium]
MSQQEGHGQPVSPAANEAGRSGTVSYDAGQASRGETPPPLHWRHRLSLKLFHTWFLFRRGMSLGVRVIAFDSEGRVFLVRHGYMPGWQLPGGGIEPGQTARQAVAMELAEEGNIELGAEPQLLGVFLNRSGIGRDHVMLYLARDVRQTTPRLPDHEIAECGFFSLEALPAGTTRATFSRLREWRDDLSHPAHW